MKEYKDCVYYKHNTIKKDIKIIYKGIMKSQFLKTQIKVSFFLTGFY